MSEQQQQPLPPYATAISTLRRTMGMTQGQLASAIGNTPRTIIQWEKGRNRPAVVPFQQMLELAIQRKAFPTGQELQECKRLWEITLEVPFDERWFSALVATPRGVIDTVRLTSSGLFALKQSGITLYPEQRLIVLFGGHEVPGVIKAGSGVLDEYFLADDGDCCGLCPGMRVKVPQ